MVLEGKCPYNSANHIKYMRGEYDKKHVMQMNFNMWVFDAPAAEFISYDPRMPAFLQLHTKEFERDEQIFEQLEEWIPKLSKELTERLINFCR